MKIRPAFHGALLGLWICLFTSSLCYGDDKTLEAARPPNKVFSSELKANEAAEVNEEGKFGVVPPKSLSKKPFQSPILKKPFPQKPYFKKPPPHKIPTFKKPIIPSAIPRIPFRPRSPLPPLPPLPPFRKSPPIPQDEKPFSKKPFFSPPIIPKFKKPISPPLPVYKKPPVPGYKKPFPPHVAP